MRWEGIEMGVIACDCQIYEICPSCAPTPAHYQRAAAAYAAPEKIPTEKSGVALTDHCYTLDEIKLLAMEFVDDNSPDNFERQLLLSVFIEWLQQREKEGEG